MSRILKFEPGGKTPKIFEYLGQQYDQEAVLREFHKQKQDWIRQQRYNRKQTEMFNEGFKAIANALGTGKISGNPDGSYSNTSGVTSDGKMDRNILGGLKRTDNNSVNLATGLLDKVMKHMPTYSPKDNRKAYSLNLKDAITRTIMPGGFVASDWENFDILDPKTKKRGNTIRQQKIASALQGVISDINSGDFDTKYKLPTNIKDKSSWSANLQEAIKHLQDGKLTNQDYISLSQAGFSGLDELLGIVPKTSTSGTGSKGSGGQGGSNNGISNIKRTPMNDWIDKVTFTANGKPATIYTRTGSNEPLQDGWLFSNVGPWDPRSYLFLRNGILYDKNSNDSNYLDMLRRKYISSIIPNDTYGYGSLRENGMYEGATDLSSLFERMDPGKLVMLSSADKARRKYLYNVDGQYYEIDPESIKENPLDGVYTAKYLNNGNLENVEFGRSQNPNFSGLAMYTLDTQDPNVFSDDNIAKVFGKLGEMINSGDYKQQRAALTFITKFFNTRDDSRNGAQEYSVGNTNSISRKGPKYYYNGVQILPLQQSPIRAQVGAKLPQTKERNLTATQKSEHKRIVDSYYNKDKATVGDVIGGRDDALNITWQDKTRLATALTDLAGVGLGFVPGANLVATATGIGSSVGQAVADYSDDRVSGWDATTSLLANLGMDVISILPVAKSLKGAKALGKIAKYASMIGTAVAASNLIENKEDVLKTVAKLKNGDISSFTKQDFYNISTIASTIFGAKRIAKYTDSKKLFGKTNTGKRTVEYVNKKTGERGTITLDESRIKGDGKKGNITNAKAEILKEINKGKPAADRIKLDDIDVNTNAIGYLKSSKVEGDVNTSQNWRRLWQKYQETKGLRGSDLWIANKLNIINRVPANRRIPTMLDSDIDALRSGPTIPESWDAFVKSRRSQSKPMTYNTKKEVKSNKKGGILKAQKGNVLKAENGDLLSNLQKFTSGLDVDNKRLVKYYDQVKDSSLDKLNSLLRDYESTLNNPDAQTTSHTKFLTNFNNLFKTSGLYSNEFLQSDDSVHPGSVIFRRLLDPDVRVRVDRGIAKYDDAKNEFVLLRGRTPVNRVIAQKVAATKDIVPTMTRNSSISTTAATQPIQLAQRQNTPTQEQNTPTQEQDIQVVRLDDPNFRSGGIRTPKESYTQFLPEDAIAFGRMLGTMRANNRANKRIQSAMRPTLIDTYKNYIPQREDYLVRTSAYNQIAELARRANKIASETSDATLGAATKLEAARQSRGIQLQADQISSQRIFQTGEQGRAEANAAKARRVEAANRNRAAMNQISLAKAQMDAQTEVGNYMQGIQPYLAGIENTLRTNRLAQRQLDSEAASLDSYITFGTERKNLYDKYMEGYREWKGDDKDKTEAQYREAMPSTYSQYLKDLDDIEIRSQKNALKNKSMINTRGIWFTRPLPQGSTYITSARKGSKLSLNETMLLEKAKDFNKTIRDQQRNFLQEMRSVRREYNAMMKQLSAFTANLIKSGMEWK